MIYETTIYICQEKIYLINELCSKRLNEDDFNKHNLSKFECFFVDGNCFSNNYQFDIKACTGDYNDTAWTEMVLFDEHGRELICTDVDDTIDGEWQIKYDDDTYIVYVKSI